MEKLVVHGLVEGHERLHTMEGNSITITINDDNSGEFWAFDKDGKVTNRLYFKEVEQFIWEHVTETNEDKK